MNDELIRRLRDAAELGDANRRDEYPVLDRVELAELLEEAADALEAR